MPVVAPEITQKPCPIAETLDKAADLLENGWIQNLLWDETRQNFCAIGAVYHTQDVHPHQLDSFFGDKAIRMCHAREAIEYAAKHAGFLNRTKLVSWNNHPDRKQEEVVAVFRGAALEAYSKGI